MDGDLIDGDRGRANEPQPSGGAGLRILAVGATVLYLAVGVGYFAHSFSLTVAGRSGYVAVFVLTLLLYGVTVVQAGRAPHDPGALLPVLGSAVFGAFVCFVWAVFLLSGAP